jgi:hypothetical protein
LDEEVTPAPQIDVLEWFFTGALLGDTAIPGRVRVVSA